MKDKANYPKNNKHKKNKKMKFFRALKRRPKKPKVLTLVSRLSFTFSGKGKLKVDQAPSKTEPPILIFGLGISSRGTV